MLKNIDRVIGGCLRNERNAQEELYRGYYAYAMTIATAYSNSEFEAEEIANDGFVKVFNRLKEYDEKFPFSPWFRRIIINAAIDHFRKNKKHSFHLEVEEARAIESDDLSALDKLSENELMELVQGLPQAYRTVFTLYVVEGFKHHEIAEQLGISEGTSKSNYARAKQKLQIEIANRLER